MSPDHSLQAFIENHVALVEPISRQAALASWQLQTESSETAKEQVTELYTRLAVIYSNKEEFELLKNISTQSLESPELARQHSLLVNSYLENQLTPEQLEAMITLMVEIEDIYNVFRGSVKGEKVSDNVIEQILAESDEEALRREAWEASKEVGIAVSAKVLKLVRMRNEAAHALGFENYYSMSLELQELSEERLFTLLDQLGTESTTLWNAYRDELDASLAKRFHITPNQVRSWHHHNRFFQSPEPGEANLDRFFETADLEKTAAAFFRNIDLPIEDLLEIADLYERPGKCQHAFCMDVDRKGDVRVLCNLQPNERWMSTLMHEYGHAVYDKFTDHSLPYLLRTPAHIMTTEAIALLMGRLTKDANWLHIYVGVDRTESDRIAQAAQSEVRNHLLVFMRWCLVMAHFERAMYHDPEQDLNTLWWDLVEKYQRIQRPEGRNFPDWASKIHLATSPVYYHNYQLGEMIASQLLHALRTQILVGETESALVTSPKVGEWLRDKVFYPGALRPWEEWLEHATGEKLNPQYFVADLQGDPK